MYSLTRLFESRIGHGLHSADVSPSPPSWNAGFIPLRAMHLSRVRCDLVGHAPPRRPPALRPERLVGPTLAIAHPAVDHVLGRGIVKPRARFDRRLAVPDAVALPPGRWAAVSPSPRQCPVQPHPPDAAEHASPSAFSFRLHAIPCRADGAAWAGRRRPGARSSPLRSASSSDGAPRPEELGQVGIVRPDPNPPPSSPVRRWAQPAPLVAVIPPPIPP
jgi:hypothetical protein